MKDFPIMEGIQALRIPFLSMGVEPQLTIHVNHREFMLLIDEALRFGYKITKPTSRVSVAGVDVVDDEGGIAYAK